MYMAGNTEKSQEYAEEKASSKEVYQNLMVSKFFNHMWVIWKKNRKQVIKDVLKRCTKSHKRSTEIKSIKLLWSDK